jgi:hypothetical protein
MHRSTVASAVIFSLFAVGCAKPEFLPPNRTLPVNVTIKCEGDSIVARINPYSISLPNSDQDRVIAEWVLTPESNADQIDINKKGDEDWPFEGTLPIEAKKTKPGKGTGIKKQKAGEYPYEYTISAMCVLNGKAKKIVIDPDIIIIWN